MTEVLMTQTAETPTEAQAAAPASKTDTSLLTQQQAPKQEPQVADKAPVAQDKAPTTATEAPKVAPEKYEFKAPEGREFDAEVMQTYTEVAKELNLTQEAAQKMLDKLAPVLEGRQTQQVESIRNGWAEASKADKEFGGEKLSENLAFAQKALNQFGSPELRSLLNESGLGNHPELIRLMVRAGKAISEDRYVGGSPASGKGAGFKSFNDLASALYPNS